VVANPGGSTHLSRRDKFALAFRIAGAVAGFAIIAVAFATSSWNSLWVLILFPLVVIGGGVSYYLLTSIVRCPACQNRMMNFRIGPIEAKRREFSCRSCGATAWLSEGFYWQDDING
jgi:hypothetical protein